MLVLTRKVGEQIVISDEIRVTVLQVRGNRVRLGIEAPAHVSIQRQEMWVEFGGECAGQARHAEAALCG